MRVLPASRTSVLVIEDDAALCELYRQELKQAGYSVVAVADGVDALRRIELGLEPDLVILDLDLPRLHGLDVYREFKAHDRLRNVPVIIVTGTDTRDLEQAEFAFVFRKPVELDALVRAVNSAVAA